MSTFHNIIGDFSYTKWQSDSSGTARQVSGNSGVAPFGALKGGASPIGIYVIPKTGENEFNKLKLYLRKHTTSSGHTLSGSLRIRFFSPGTSHTGTPIATTYLTNAQINALPLGSQAFQETTISFSNFISLPAHNYNQYIIALDRPEGGTSDNDIISVAYNEYWQTSYEYDMANYNPYTGPTNFRVVARPGNPGQSAWDSDIYNAVNPDDMWDSTTYKVRYSIIFKLESATEAVALQNTVEVKGKKMAKVAQDPRAVPVLQADGSGLPAGTIVKNSENGQKFVKVAGSSTAYNAVPITSPASWKMGSFGSAAWAVLQEL